MYRPNLKFVASSVPEIYIAIAVLGGGLGVANPNLGEEEAGRRGSGMLPCERALVSSSYRPSIVTFPLSLRVAEILPLLCSSRPLFPAPPLSKLFPPCSPGSRWMGFGLRRAKMLG